MVLLPSVFSTALTGLCLRLLIPLLEYSGDELVLRTSSRLIPRLGREVVLLHEFGMEDKIVTIFSKGSGEVALA